MGKPDVLVQPQAFNNRCHFSIVRNIASSKANENCFAQRDVLDMFAESEAAGRWQKRGSSSGLMHVSQRPGFHSSGDGHRQTSKNTA